MKKIIALFLFISSVVLVNAQANTELSGLLNTYYTIKNALVAGDAAKSSAQANEFVKFVGKVEAGKLSADEQKAFQAVQAKLSADAKAIGEAKDISKQRESFSSFSNNMISLAKAVKLSAQPVYVDYCPMKKASWLSAEQPIKNPYYGNSMLTCGSVKDTIK